MAETQLDFHLEIAHVLFIDIVGYSKLLINEQGELLQELNQIVRNTSQFRKADASGELIRLPTGDGMILVFLHNAEAPVQCAIEISEALRTYPKIQLRMGVHSGPVNQITDVNDKSNLAGAGINVAQRIMDCGDAGHILLSKRVADDLAHYRQWQSCLHDLGEFEVKHGVRIHVVNLYTDDSGNAALPEKFKRGRKQLNFSPARKGEAWQRSVWIAGVLIAVVALLIGFWFFWQRGSEKLSGPAGGNAAHFGGNEKRIAVLPFKPLTPENRDQILELGMADSLITKLSNSRQIIVRSLASVRKYGGLDQDSLAAGRDLQADSVLEGNVQKSGDHIRVTARLINVADGASLWAGTFDEKMTDVFGVQDAISQKVADALALRLSGEEKERLTRRYTENVEAYQLYLTGRYHWAKFTPPDIRKGIGFFQKAIELDPKYALAYFGFAEANRSLAINADVPSKDCLPQAKAAAIKALGIDDSLAEAHASLSFSLIWYDWDWVGGVREAQRAIALNSNSAHSHFALAHVLSDQGHHNEALAEMARARELDPVFLLYRALEGMFFYHARRDVEALDRLQKTVDLDPNFWVTHLTLGKVYTQQRKYPEAIEELGKARELSHGNSEAIASIGYAAALAGDKAKARAVLDELKALSNEHYVPPVNVALVLSSLGEKDEALASLEKGCAERDVRLTLLKVDPRWDSLRSDPRFIAILKRIGLQ
ncbi:MAG TPA: adenylate/guanylate cyclase domain-containing protein [Chthoniobacterales bacterium]|nr:adenylate/guanylate cyclase domain-containing protein [Chthoniobacterales bacterium]